LILQRLTAKPYRLTGHVRADFLEVERLLANGNVDGALDAYKGSLLPSSQAPDIGQARDQLDAALFRAVSHTPTLLWRWLQTPPASPHPGSFPHPDPGHLSAAGGSDLSHVGDRLECAMCLRRTAHPSFPSR
jgi:hypothetical protein